MRFQSQKVARNNIIYQQYLPQSPRECLVTTMVRASPLGHNMAYKGTRIEEPKRFSYLFVMVVMAIFNPRRLTLQPSKCGWNMSKSWGDSNGQRCWRSSSLVGSFPSSRICSPTQRAIQATWPPPCRTADPGASIFLPNFRPPSFRPAYISTTWRKQTAQASSPSNKFFFF